MNPTIREFLYHYPLEVTIPEEKLDAVVKHITKVGREFSVAIECTRYKEPGTRCFQLSIVALSSQYANIYFRIGQIFESHKINKPLT